MKNRHKDDFFLSDTPQFSSKIKESVYIRLVVWIKLKDKKSDETFYFFATHFDHLTSDIGRKAREKQAQIAIKQVKRIAGETPLVFVGDFNCEDTEKAYTSLTKLWKDAYHISATPPQGGYKNGKDTYTGLYHINDSTSKRIDYIFVDESKIKVNSYNAPDTKMGHSTYPSDHLPIYSECRFK